VTLTGEKDNACLCIALSTATFVMVLLSNFTSFSSLMRRLTSFARRHMSAVAVPML